VIRGIVIKKFTKWSDYPNEGLPRDRYCVLILADDKTACYELSGFATRVHQELGRVNPAIGDRVGVRFLGIKQGKRKGTAPYGDIQLVNYDRPNAGAVEFKPPAEDTVDDEAPVEPDVPIDREGLPTNPSPVAEPSASIGAEFGDEAPW
jgi:hypothetical protein